MKRTLVLISMVGLGYLFAWGASEDTSKQQTELENLKTELQQLKPNIEKAANEKSALEVEIAFEQQNREQLQQKVDELTSDRVNLTKQVEKLTFTCEQSRQQLEEIIKARDNLKQRTTVLTDTRNELQQQLAALTTSRNQLKRQVDELSKFRDAEAVKVQAAQDRVDILLAMINGETEGTDKQQNETKTTELTKEQTQPAVIKVSEDPDVLTAINWPPVVSKQDEGRPVCHSFGTSHSQITPGQTSILSWQVSNAQSIRIEPGIGRVSPLGSRAVKPSATTTYTLVAGNKEGQSRLSCRVEVTERITAFSNDSIHPQVLLEQDKTPEDSEVLSGQKPQESDPNSTLGKFIGYRARQDESGKFIFVPIFEKKQEE